MFTVLTALAASLPGWAGCCLPKPQEARERREREEKLAAAAEFQKFAASFQEGSQAAAGTTFIRGGVQGGGASKSTSRGSVDASGREYKLQSKRGRGVRGAGASSSSSGLSDMQRMMQEMAGRTTASSAGISGAVKSSTGSSSSSSKVGSSVAATTTSSTTTSIGSSRVTSSNTGSSSGTGGGGVSGASSGGKPRVRALAGLLEEIKQRKNLPAGSDTRASANDAGMGEFDPTGMSTNIYVRNVAPTLTEEALGRKFARYGDLYSVKIMWPRSEEERMRGRNTGFVAFVRRDEAEDAMEAMQVSWQHKQQHQHHIMSSE